MTDKLDNPLKVFHRLWGIFNLYHFGGSLRSPVPQLFSQALTSASAMDLPALIDSKASYTDCLAKNSLIA
jgi:hypothetical protein